MPRDALSGMMDDPKLPRARDVVCGRNVRPEHAKGETEYGGETYFFCCEECLRRFEDEPARYASETSGAAGGSRLPWPGPGRSGNES